MGQGYDPELHETAARSRARYEVGPKLTSLAKEEKRRQDPSRTVTDCEYFEHTHPKSRQPNHRPDEPEWRLVLTDPETEATTLIKHYGQCILNAMTQICDARYALLAEQDEQRSLIEKLQAWGTTTPAQTFRPPRPREERRFKEWKTNATLYGSNKDYANATRIERIQADTVADTFPIDFTKTRAVLREDFYRWGRTYFTESRRQSTNSSSASTKAEAPTELSEDVGKEGEIGVEDQA